MLGKLIRPFFLVCFFLLFLFSLMVEETLKDAQAADIESSPFGTRNLYNVQAGTVATTQQAGAKWVRWTSFIWDDIEPEKGAFNWNTPDEIISALQSAGIDIIPVIRDISFWGSSEEIIQKSLEQQKKGGGAPLISGYPADVEGYKDFLRRFVERYDGDSIDDMPKLIKPVEFWQIDVEYPTNWGDTKENLVEYLKVSYEAIKEADSKAKVIVGGLVSSHLDMFIIGDGYLGDEVTLHGKTYKRAEVISNPKYIEFRDFDEYLLQNGVDYFDIMDIHLYGNYELTDEKVRWVRDRVGYDKPIWALESGGPMEQAGEEYTDAKNAEYVVKLYTVTMANGVERMCWMLNPDGAYWGGTFQNLSLLNLDKEKKPSYYTYRLMVDKLEGLEDKIETLSLGENIYAYRFGGEQKSTYLLWYEDEGQSLKSKTVSLDVASDTLTLTHIITDWGQTQPEVEYVNAVDGKVSLTLTGSPIFLEDFGIPVDTIAPATVTDLTVFSSTTDSITLTWTAPGDDGNVGQATSYDIRYSTSLITASNWAAALQCEDEPKPSTANSPQSFTVTGLQPDTSYYFAIKAIDEASNISSLSKVIIGSAVELAPKYTLALSQGINMISVPLKPNMPWKLSDLARYIGPEVTLVIYYDKENKKFVSYMPGWPETVPANITVKGGEGYILIMREEASVTFVGTAWDGEVKLSSGINIISVPLDPGVQWRLSDILSYIGVEAKMIIRYDTTAKKFLTYMSTFPMTAPANAPVSGGEGYIVIMSDDKTIEFVGKAWEN